jgi:hypothetical protein
MRGRGSQPELREEQAGSSGVADRLAVLTKPGNAGGGKEPDFWRVTGRDQESGDWREPINSISDSAVTERTLLVSEDCAVFGFTAETTQRVVCWREKPVGEPGALIAHAGFDERECGNGVWWS